VLAGLAALVTVGVVLGLLLAWASTEVLDATGIADDGSNPSEPVLELPPDAATSTGPTGNGPGSTEPTSATPRPSPSGDGTLTASPEAADSFEQVTLSGRLPGVAAGTSLQVERREGGSWVTFPVTVTTDASGGFSTFVELGQVGPNELRLVLPGSTRSTPQVTVTVG